MNTPYKLKLPGFIPDVSSHEDVADLKNASPRPAGIITRATVAMYPSAQERYRCVEVRDDPTVEEYFRQTREQGLLFGVYAYILQNKIQAQAQAFIRRCQMVGLVRNGEWLPEFPPIADVEIEALPRPKKAPKSYIPALQGAAWAAQVKEWLDTVESALGIRPMIYTAFWQWKWVCGVNMKPPAWAKDYEFWLKYYPLPEFQDRNPVIPDKAMLPGIPREKVMLWQYEESGRSRGFQFNDLNVLTDFGTLKYGNPDHEHHPEPMRVKGLFTTDSPDVGSSWKVVDKISAASGDVVTLEEV